MTIDPVLLTFGVLAIIVGSTLQRVSGAGVGLVVSPVLALLLGPTIGIFATNIVTIVSATMLMFVRWKEIEWRRAGLILLAAIPGSIAGALLVRELSSAWLSITIGVVILIGIAVSLSTGRAGTGAPRGAIGVAGFVGGMFNTTAGVGGPAVIVYARSVGWEHPRFGATLQPIFLGMGVLSVATKLALGASGFTGEVPWWLLAVVIAAVGCGVLIGHLLARRVSAATAGKLVLGIAGAGGLVALVRGLLQLG